MRKRNRSEASPSCQVFEYKCELIATSTGRVGGVNKKDRNLQKREEKRGELGREQTGQKEGKTKIVKRSLPALEIRKYAHKRQILASKNESECVCYIRNKPAQSSVPAQPDMWFRSMLQAKNEKQRP